MIIFGTGEIAQLAKFYFENDYGIRVDAFTVDDNYVREDKFEDRPVIPFSEIGNHFPSEMTDMHVALSYRGLNKLREEKYNQCKARGYRLVSYVSSYCIRWSGFIPGFNCFILEQNNIQPGARIGNNVMLWSGNHIGHGSHIGDHNYFASHVVVSGNCKIGERNFFGVNSTIKDFTAIGSDCFITMDASVIKDVPDNSVVIGRDIINGEKAEKIKAKYFGNSQRPENAEIQA